MPRRDCNVRVAFRLGDRQCYAQIVEQRQCVLAQYTAADGQQVVGSGQTVNRAMADLLNKLGRSTDQAN